MTTIIEETEEYKEQKKKETIESLLNNTESSIEEQELFNDEDYWEQSAEEAIRKLDKQIGWKYDEQQPTDWTYQKLLEKYEHLKNVTLENMPEVWTGLEFALSVKSTLNMADNTLPFPGILLGPSSGSKTVIIEMFKGYKHVLYLDSFSPRSFVSHNTSVPKEKLGEVDLLPKLKNKLFLVSELAPIFSAKDEDLLQVMGILTRVVDGQGYQNHTGAQGLRGYDENIMFSWIGASVDIPPKVFKVLGTLGPKLYFFRLPREEETEDYYFDLKDENFHEKKHKIRTALHEYLAFFDMNPESTVDEGELTKIPLQKPLDEGLAYRIIIRIAKLLARLRATVPTWETRDTQGSDYAYGIAKIENPKRAITQLSNLARGHALSQGRKYIILDDIPLVIHTALSTASMERVRIFELLIENKGKLTTSQICQFLNTTPPTARRTMVELKATGLVIMDETLASDGRNTTHMIALNQEFDWFLTDEFKQLKDKFYDKPNLETTQNQDEGSKGEQKEKYPPGGQTVNQESNKEIQEQTIQNPTSGGSFSFTLTESNEGQYPNTTSMPSGLGLNQVTDQDMLAAKGFIFYGGYWHCQHCKKNMGDKPKALKSNHNCRGTQG